ncbi:MAG: hypothetical protein ACYTKD_17665 [Planctomycetota bacterium]|jgi:hypothetical protein
MPENKKGPEGAGVRGPTKPDGNKHVGLLVLALWVVGVGGLLGAVAAFNASHSQGFSGAGFCLLASAVAFGQLLNALVRK